MRVALVVFVMALAGCVAPPPLIKDTASGYPEETVRGATAEAVRAAVMDTCISRGAMVQESSVNNVVCARTMKGGDAILAQLVVGNSYSTTPEQKARFTIYQSGPDVRITVQQWIETQMALGQVRRIEQNGNQPRNEAQMMLGQIARAVGSAAPPTPTPPPVATVTGDTPVSTPTAGNARQPMPARGDSARDVERMVEARKCAATPRPALTAKGPGFESYSVACDNGDSLAVRCEYGTCRVLR